MERMTSQGWKSTVTGNSLAPLPCEKFTKGKVKSVGKEKEKELSLQGEEEYSMGSSLT
jgi:hypothetical protein